MLELFSDGGGERSSTAAAACILRYKECTLQLVAYLGPATNNEAEIFAGLLAFAAIPQLQARCALDDAALSSLVWHCDSEYVLKSACGYINAWQKNGWKTAAKKPVKNQALWRAYLALSRDRKVKPQHVYGHSGHHENEACDSAATWARMHGQAHLAQLGEGSCIALDSSYAQGEWFLLDGSTYLDRLRELEGAELDTEDSLFLRCYLAQLAIGTNDTQHITSIPAAAPSTNARKKTRAQSPAQEFQECIEQLRSLTQRLAGLSAVVADAEALRAELQQVLERRT